MGLNLRKPDFPCKKDCPDRSPACHAICQQYIAARKALDEKRAKERANRKGDIDFIEYAIDRKYHADV